MPRARKPEAIGWAQPLAAPVVLRDGRRLETLMDAAELLLGLPEARQAKPVWLKLHQELITATAPGIRMTSPMRRYSLGERDLEGL